MTQVMRSGHHHHRSGTVRSGNFPAFQLANQDVCLSSIRVIAQAPSGRSQQLGVKVDPTGQFTTDFIPNECGDWTICILSNGENIAGSPFRVRVYDPGQVKVHGLEGGAMGQPVNFQVDTGIAGDGCLTVDVLYHNRSVPAEICRRGNNYSVHFDPVGPGIYKVHVCYASQEVAGSPFTVEIVNSGSIMLSGDGLHCAVANKRAFFIVHMGDNKGLPADLAVRVTSPRGRRLQTSVTPTGDGGDFMVEYRPTETGEHTIEVAFFGRMVQGCPYRCQVYDWNQISVLNMPKVSVLGRPVCFDIDAVDSGNGRLEILVNDGAVPCKVEKKNGRRYTASFAPTECGDYVIDMKFNCHTIPGSPWLVKVINADHVRIEGADRNAVHVNTETSFDVITCPYDGQVCVGVRSPSGRSIPVNIRKVGDDCHRVDFVPTEIGPYEVTVTYEGLCVLGSPFQIMACDPNAILVSTVHCVVLGNPVEFNVDASRAGPGDLEIQVNRGTVPSKAEVLGPSNYQVSFFPTEAGRYVTDIQFNGKILAQSPMITNVIDLSAVVVHGASPCIARVGKPHVVRVDTKNAGDAKLIATVMSPTCQIVPSRITEVADHCYEIEFTPCDPGPHRVDIDYCSAHVPASPVMVMAYDVSKIRVLGVQDGFVGKKSAFSVALNDCGEGELEVVIMSCHGRPILNQVTALEPGRLEATYIPQEGGIHFAEVTFNKEHVCGSPFQFMVYDPCRATARGEGLDMVQCNQRATFIVNAPDAKLSDIDVRITSPTGRDVMPNISETGNGVFKVDYVPTQTGIYQVDITYFGLAIPCSPFQVKAWDAGKVLIANLCRGHVGCESFFNIELGEAGDGTVEISIMDPNGQLIQNQVITKGPGLLEVHYVPAVMGDHKVNVVFNGVKVPGCPMTFQVLDSSKVTARGDGLGLVQVGCPTAFMVYAPEAKLKDLDIRVIAPNGNELLTNIIETAPGTFRVEYTPPVVGTYQIPIQYCCNPIIGSPFTAHAWDASRVLLADVGMGVVGCPSSFKVLVGDAGEGVVEISITDPQGQLLANQAGTLEPGVVVVNYVPTMYGIHRGNILFNKQKVPGSPFTFLVIDRNSTYAQGEGLGCVRCSRQTSFFINAPAATVKDLFVRITGPGGRDIPYRITEKAAGCFTVDYTPNVPGEYQIETKYFDCPIKDSPFTAVAWDCDLVTVTNIKCGMVGKPTFFHINPSEAGPGNLEVSITAGGESVRNTLRKLDRSGLVECSYTPINIHAHHINVKFNSEPVNGSPFIATIMDGSQATAQGPGLGRVMANCVTFFDVSSRQVGCDCDLQVFVTSPCGQHVPAYITGSGSNNFHVEYMPIEAGKHIVCVLCAGMDIKGSPFPVDVFDPCQVRIHQNNCGVVGKPVKFSVDTSMAGLGKVTVDVRGDRSHPIVECLPSTTGQNLVSFIPQEGCVHTVIVKFNDHDVPGSPFPCNVIDQKLLQVRWDAVRLVPVRQPAVVELDVTSSSEAQAACNVIDPTGRALALQQRRVGTVFGFMYVPEVIGPHIIEMSYGCDTVPGSPFTCNAYDVSKVRIVDATACGNIGQEVGFTVDTSQAGMGTLETTVTCGAVNVPIRFVQLSADKHQYFFVARSPQDHLIKVTFNGEHVPGCPLVWRIVNPASKMCLSSATIAKSVAIGQIVAGVIQHPGYPINPSDITARVVSPSGDIVPTRVTQQADGSIRIEYTAMSIGTHMLYAEYAGQMVPGSPLPMEVFDPNKVQIEGQRIGQVGCPMVVDINFANAGLADLCVTVLDPSGGAVPIQTELTPSGQRIVYVPSVPGTHRIHVTYGGLDVPGCPVSQEIAAIVPILASGEGLVKGVVGQVATFYVDTKGQKGQCCAKIQGPSTLARIQIEPEQGGRLKINYVPEEVGIFSIDLQFNGCEIEGTPFHPRIVDPCQVQVIDDFSTWNGPDRFCMPVNDLKTLRFDTSCAGPGQLSCKIEGPDGKVTPDILQHGMDGYAVKFVPHRAGDYYIRVYWNDLPICKFPIIGTAGGSACSPCAPAAAGCCPSSVVVVGPGLTFARVAEPARFMIDASKAGCGVPSVRIVGVQEDIECCMEEVAPGQFGCTYVPNKPGAYLLNVMWNDQHTCDSPYKINIKSGSDASKVVCSGEGLTCGVLGQDLHVLVDTRRAGPGELIARCEGPTRPAYCDVEDRRDGTYEVIIRPQECGIHLLYILYDGRDVPGSAFNIKVVPAPDASKVTVCGEGIQNGILATFESDFTVNTCGAGPGQLTVKVRAKKGAFRVEMQRSKESDRIIHCRYHPTEIGEYFIHVQWSGVHVPNSPFRVVIVDTREELRRLNNGSNQNDYEGMYGLGRPTGSEFGTVSDLGGYGQFQFDDA